MIRSLHLSTVFRIENDTHHGCYRSDANVLPFGDLENHPTPSEDLWLRDFYFDRFNPEIHYFAFSDLNQLRRWVYEPSWRQGLHNAGFHITEIRAPAIHGETQAIFDMFQRVDLATYSLLEI